MRWKTVSALILGLAGALFAWVPVLGLVVAVVALILAVGAVQEHADSFAYGALTLSIVASITSAVFLVGTLIRAALV